ncbi:MAG: hypothetical protein BM565_06010 [Gammaproteobacteria bacterium MedPE]|nr:MAG: hypothetical protein BM565_06010 [Gammaproteobacteria bacterium MedPE]
MKAILLLSLFVVQALFITVNASTPNKEKWISITIDNDAFVGNDSGYSNGLFVSTFEVNEKPSKTSENDFWVSPLMWSMPQDNFILTANAYSFGQSLNTPSDIKIENPDENELPYSAILAMSNSYITVTPQYADLATTTLGVVGPMALGEEVQTFVHKILGANEPQGWDTQIKNEVVFELSRARSYRVWHTQDNHFDVLMNGRASLGTIETALDVGTFIRYGNNLQESHATTLLAASRISNPIAVDGWYFFLGSRVGYMFNHIAIDGNTFRDSRSIDYKKQYVSLTTGFAYTWRDVSITFAINDFNILKDNEEEQALADLTEFGTISFSWKI